MSLREGADYKALMVSQPNCFQHPAIAASAKCGGCGKYLCAQCALPEGDAMLCAGCAGARHRQYSRLTLVPGLLAGSASCTVGLVVFFVVGGMSAPGPVGGASSQAADAPFDYGKKAVLIRHLQDELARQPCDKAKGREYVQALFDAGDMKGTIRAGDDFIAKCGKSTVLRQLTYMAHTRRQEFELAAKDVTELLEGAPNNAGYLIWRGMAHQANGALDAAVADFRQAFLLNPGEAQLANLLATTYGDQGRLCDARLVVQEHLQAQPSQAAGSKMAERLASLGGAKRCGGDGEGGAELAVADTLPEGADGLLGLSFLARFDVKQDAKAGRWVLSARKSDARAVNTP